ncbi:MAG: arsenate reductase (thioredoxin) [Nitrospinota bacterium]
MMKKILFLCTGNSCRSQMAEGFARHPGKELLEVRSAGLKPAGVNPRAIQVMKEVQIDISDQTSDKLNKERIKDIDMIITLCGDAEENCPVTPPHIKRIHWPLKDPARAKGTDEEIIKQFRAVRDEIKKRVEDLIASLVT